MKIMLISEKKVKVDGNVARGHEIALGCWNMSAKTLLEVEK
jgi:hypothetical protein